MLYNVAREYAELGRPVESTRAFDRLLADPRGVGAAESLQMAGAVERGFARVEAAAHGVQSGLRFLSLVVGAAGLLATILLVRSGAARPA